MTSSLCGTGIRSDISDFARICRTVAATSQILFKQCLSKALAKHTQIHPRDTPKEKEKKSTRRPWKGFLQTFMYDGKLPPVRCFPLVGELLGTGGPDNRRRVKS
jgi:hypothetical protein